jgi:hypothetical protein
MYQPAVGDRVRVIRTAAKGYMGSFTATGTIVSVDRHDYWGYGFVCDVSGYYRLASNEQLARHMPSMTQTIERE